MLTPSPRGFSTPDTAPCRVQTTLTSFLFQHPSSLQGRVPPMTQDCAGHSSLAAMTAHFSVFSHTYMSTGHY